MFLVRYQQPSSYTLTDLVLNRPEGFLDPCRHIVHMFPLTLEMPEANVNVEYVENVK